MREIPSGIWRVADDPVLPDLRNTPGLEPPDNWCGGDASASRPNRGRFTRRGIRIEKLLVLRVAFLFWGMSNRQTVIINYQTPDLLRQAVTSFRTCYPEERLELIDNGSNDDSVQVLEELASLYPESTSVTVHPKNLFHGPAMHRALLDADAEHVFILDSDTVTRKSRFLERMSKVLDDQGDVYAVGQVARVDRRGFATEEGNPVPVSAHMMIRRRMYLELPPFEHHGLPVLRNCLEAGKRGWRISEFPIQEYVDHLGRGTAERFGYGLGWKSRLDYLLHRLGF